MIRRHFIPSRKACQFWFFRRTPLEGSSSQLVGNVWQWTDVALYLNCVQSVDPLDGDVFPTRVQDHASDVPLAVELESEDIVSDLREKVSLTLRE